MKKERILIIQKKNDSKLQEKSLTPFLLSEDELSLIKGGEDEDICIGFGCGSYQSGPNCDEIDARYLSCIMSYRCKIKI